MLKNMTKNELLILGLIVVAAVATGIAMARPKANSGFDAYGFNQKAKVFLGCYSNFVAWRTGKPPTTCRENDAWGLVKWHFDTEGHLDWWINHFWCESGSVFKKFVNLPKEECESQGGVYIKSTIVYTGEPVDVCEIQRVIAGDFQPCLGSMAPGETIDSFVALPAGFGAYSK